MNVARRILLAKRGRTIENIPPTLDALKQHIKQSAFQVFYLRQCLITKCVALKFENLLTSSRYFSELKDLSLDGLAM